MLNIEYSYKKNYPLIIKLITLISSSNRIPNLLKRTTTIPDIQTITVKINLNG